MERERTRSAGVDSARARRGLALALLACFAALLAAPGAGGRPRPLARSYPGDVGIGNDRRVIFAEDFSGATPAQVAGRWSSAQPERASLVAGVEGAADGQALQLRVVGGQWQGATFFKRLAESHDELYVRYYTRYQPGSYNHNGLIVGGFDPPTDYALGTCCTAPDGDRAFTVHLELIEDSFGQHLFPGPHQQFGFYSYWMEMMSWGDGTISQASCTDPLTGATKPCAAGNRLMKGAHPRIPFGEWVAVEVHVRLNDPVSERNGMLQMWINGLTVIQGGREVSSLGPGFPKGRSVGYGEFTPDASATTSFQGFRWRDDPALGLNFIWLNHFSPHAASGEVSLLDFDQLVVATDYIGPMATGEPAPPPPPPAGLQLAAQAVPVSGGVRVSASVTGGQGPYQYLFDCGVDGGWDAVRDTAATSAEHTCPTGTGSIKAWVWDKGTDETREKVVVPGA